MRAEHFRRIAIVSFVIAVIAVALYVISLKVVKANEREAVEAKEFANRKKEYAKKAKAHLDAWKQAFVGPNTGITCYHGDNFASPPTYPDVRFYRITCQVGTKGAPPNMKLECDQLHCIVEKP